MDFFSAMSLSPPRAHLVAKGEFDAFAAAELRPRLDEAVDRGCIHVSVDMSAVSFVDAGGLGTLVWLRSVVGQFGGTVVVTAASPRFRQIAELVGLGAAFDLDLLPDPPPSVVPAAASIRSRDGRRARRQLHVPPPIAGSTVANAR